MDFVPTAIPGCLEIRPQEHADERGIFVKIFHEPTFRARGLSALGGEEFYSISKRGTLRGLHFHLPPHDHTKLVYCAAGAVLQAVLDLRRGSPTFGRHLVFERGPGRRAALYIPSGLAHGFYALSDDSLLVYRTSAPYAPGHDAGLRWDSAGIPWPDASPILSARDRGFPALERFESPFSFTAAG